VAWGIAAAFAVGTVAGLTLGVAAPATALAIHRTRIPTESRPLGSVTRDIAVPEAKSLYPGSATTLLPAAPLSSIRDPSRLQSLPVPPSWLPSTLPLACVLTGAALLTITRWLTAGATRPLALAAAASEHTAGATKTKPPPAKIRDETAEEAARRRAAESKQVEDRVVTITSLASLQAHLKAQTDPRHLFVAEVMDPNQCSSGLEEEAEIHWKRTEEEVMAPCVRFKHTFQRTARNCKDVSFFQISRDGTPEVEALLQRLEVKIVPSLLFIKEGRIVWRHDGFSGVDQDLGDGMLWFGATSVDGTPLRDLVPDLTTVTDLEAFRRPSDSTDLLRVVVVLTGTANTCIHLYPAIPAVAKHLKGRATFARLRSDVKDAREAVRQLNVNYVPSMIIFDAKTGKEVARHVVTSRGDLIGLLLQSLEHAEKQRADAGEGPQRSSVTLLSLAGRRF